jgi:protoporphyrinogen oxidase
MKVVILGAGLSGMSVAQHLKKDYAIFEKEGACGGLCRSRQKGGFTFDIAGHLLHFKDKRNLSFVQKLLGDNCQRHERDSWVWSHGRFIPYPFQSNLPQLPDRVARDCFAGLKRVRHTKKKISGATDLESWFRATFGPGICRHFLFPYNRKFWHYPLKDIRADGVSRWIPPAAQRGYNAEFWYPVKGGIQSLANALKDSIKKIHTGKEAVKIDFRNKEVCFRDGKRACFDRIVSTIPLPELGKMIPSLPTEVRQSFLKLKYVSVFNINLGLKKDPLHSKQWIYFAQRNISFYRLGVATNFCVSSAPKGCSAMYFEISYLPDGPFDKRHALDRVLKDCRRFGLSLTEQDIRQADINDLQYAYCVYDKDRERCVRVIKDYLAKQGCLTIGRYGGWQYSSIEDALDEGRKTAQELNQA